MKMAKSELEEAEEAVQMAAAKAQVALKVASEAKAAAEVAVAEEMERFKEEKEATQALEKARYLLAEAAAEAGLAKVMMETAFKYSLKADAELYKAEAVAAAWAAAVRHRAAASSSFKISGAVDELSADV
jgi:hypothetical protein